jgi:hypothetical protein
MLIQAFTLHTQGFTDSWNFSPLFGDWTSANADDALFGGRLWSTETMHEGCNALFFQPPDSKVHIPRLLELLAGSLESKAPTRFIVVVPKQNVLPKPFLEIASLSPRSPLFDFEYSEAKVASSIVLGINKHSMATDPINWESFLHRIQDWSQNWSPGLLTINTLTDALFRERTYLSHSPRILSKHPENIKLKSFSSLNFYDIFSPKTPTPLSSTIPSRASELIRKANQHPCFLGVLGILPNQLRTLLKEFDHKNREEALLDISRTLFFAGFDIWQKRQNLNHIFWKDIKPENKKIRTPKRKKARLENVHYKISVQILSISWFAIATCRNKSQQNAPAEMCFRVILILKHSRSQNFYINFPK